MIYLCVVNHGHDELIMNNKNMLEIAKDYKIIIKSNTPATPALIDYSLKNKIELLDESYQLGFGENNNYVFNHIQHTNSVSKNDYFLVINPDVEITLSELNKLKITANEIDSEIYTINLFKDSEFKKHDESIKHFPKLTDPIVALLGKKRKDAYDKSSISHPTEIDWAAGSFLLFKNEAYKKLNGFNKRYFMYFEDVDICRRAKQKKMRLTYLPNIKAKHAGAFKNRDIFSKHFRWYLTSYLKYHLLK